MTEIGLTVDSISRIASVEFLQMNEVKTLF